MNERLDNIEAPPVISVTFDPIELSSGRVDVEDLAQFLDGLRLAFEGAAEYDASMGVQPERTNPPRLTLIQTRESSVICDIIINLYFFSFNNVSINTQIMVDIAKVVIAADVAIDTSAIIASVIKKAIEGAATETLKDGMVRAIKAGVSKTAEVTSQFMSALRAATTPPKADGHADLPPEKMLGMLPGLRKMANIGAKQAYGSKGVPVTSTSNQKVVFDADARRNIEENAKKARNSKAPIIELVGTIENPNRKLHRFVLAVPGQSASKGNVPCQYSDGQLVSLVDALYAGSDFVRVVGEKRYKPRRNAKPTMYIVVSSLEHAEPPTLWT